MGVVMAGLMPDLSGRGDLLHAGLDHALGDGRVSRLHQGFAAGLSNMAWAAGQVVGGLAGGAVASVAGNAAPGFAIIALLLVNGRLLVPRSGAPAAAAAEG